MRLFIKYSLVIVCIILSSILCIPLKGVGQTNLKLELSIKTFVKNKEQQLSLSDKIAEHGDLKFNENKKTVSAKTLADLSYLVRIDNFDTICHIDSIKLSKISFVEKDNTMYGTINYYLSNECLISVKGEEILANTENAKNVPHNIVNSSSEYLNVTFSLKEVKTDSVTIGCKKVSIKAIPLATQSFSITKPRGYNFYSNEKDHAEKWQDSLYECLVDGRTSINILVSKIPVMHIFMAEINDVQNKARVLVQLDKKIKEVYAPKDSIILFINQAPFNFTSTESTEVSKIINDAFLGNNTGVLTSAIKTEFLNYMNSINANPNTYNSRRFVKFYYFFSSPIISENIANELITNSISQLFGGNQVSLLEKIDLYIFVENKFKFRRSKELNPYFDDFTN